MNHLKITGTYHVI